MAQALRPSLPAPATLAEVARRAGVSPATASRALNNSGAVRPKVRTAVGQAAQELGYVGHGPARALASRRTRLIGAIVPTLDNPIFARCLEALQQRLAESGLTVLLGTSGYDAERELVGIRTLLERGVDGLMLVGSTRAESTHRLIAAKRVPLCHTWCSAAEPGHAHVGFDNRAAMARVAAYLYEIGHRHFGMIAGLTEGNDRALDRLMGVRETLAERGLTLAVRERPYTLAAGQEALRDLMRAGKPPTAVICGNDLLAFGAIAACRALELAVPEDVSVTGFDDLDIAADLSPSLTTVHVAAEEIGRRAAELLIGRLRGDDAQGGDTLNANLVVRNSTAPPPVTRRLRRNLDRLHDIDVTT